MCHYEYGIWNVAAKRVLKRQRVEKPKAELTQNEIDPWGCTPCIEDQVWVKLSTGISFQICKVLAGPIHEALEAAIAEGAIIQTVVGYRPSMSRGPTDPDHNRTQLSNHAFGTALDINERNNGLYSECVSWSSSCRLIRGGPWKAEHPLSLTSLHPVVKELTQRGFKWGGDILGKQKDMMHFSQTGY